MRWQPGVGVAGGPRPGPVTTKHATGPPRPPARRDQVGDLGRPAADPDEHRGEHPAPEATGDRGTGAAALVAAGHAVVRGCRLRTLPWTHPATT
jgi:hypothetical protein